MKRISLILLLVLPAACKSSSGGDDEGANADEYFYDCEDAKKPDGLTVYATDEAYRAFLDKVTAGAQKKDDTQAAKLTSPMADSTLSIATPPAFSIAAPMAMAPRPTRMPNPRNLVPTQHHRSRWAWVKDLFSIEGTAWAHCPNVTGPLYLVTVKEMGKDEAAYSALVSVPSFTPGADAWKAKLTPLSGKKVTVTVARGVFSMGEIQLGPFVPTQDPSFTVGP